MRTSRVLTLGVVAASLTLAGCSNTGQEVSKATSAATSAASSASSAVSSKASEVSPSVSASASSMSSKMSTGMEHKMDGGPAPAGMKKAENPKYAVGSTVKLTADHMPGMKDSTAKIVGAYTTHVYAVDYEPISGGPKVTNHKWVVQEELEGVGDKKLAKGDTATMTADHMPGMKGAKATIASETDETVYIVDYDMNGMTMKNHKWVVESEIQPAK